MHFLYLTWMKATIVSISCCCGARASHTLSTHTTQHLILRYVSYHRFCKHMCAQAITSRSITFATTRNTRAAKMSKIVSSLGHRAVLVSVECTRYTRALWRTLALYHGVQVTLRFWTFFQHLCLVWLLIVKQQVKQLFHTTTFTIFRCAFYSKRFPLPMSRNM